MRDKVLAAIEAYSAGGTIEKALQSVGISKTPFRRILKEEPEVMALYEAAMRSRSYVFLDDAFTVADEMGTENGLDPANARVKAEILMKLSGAANPDRFGNRVNVQHEVKPSIINAIEEGRKRSLRPPCDPALITDAEYTDISAPCALETSDKQSAAPEIASDADAIDPFEP